MNLQYFPVSLPFLLLLSALFALLLILIQIGVLEYAYARLGIDRRFIFILLLLSLLGSYVNIPVAVLPGHVHVASQYIEFGGITYSVPVVVGGHGTVIAVNLGGAVVPTLLSIYLMLKNNLLIRGLIATGVVTAVVHGLAQPVPGLGIAVPIFVPPLVSAAVAVLLAWRRAAPLAYIGGSLGTLIGADLLNLGRVQELGAPVASIGGAGTFDGIFLTSIFAVLLASLVTPRMRRERRP